MFHFTGIPMKEFIGLRPKMYSLKYDFKKKNQPSVKEITKMTAKGITKTAREKQLSHEHFRKCLFENQRTTHDMKVIKRENHQLYLNKVTKKGLCNFDDKRFWLGKRVGENVSSKFENSTDDIGAVHSLAFGHYKINLLK
jgi:hypothetical protein